MAKQIIKISIGILLGILVYLCLISEGLSGFGYLVLDLAWGVGIVYGGKIFVGWMRNALVSSMHMSVISWMSFGTGILGVILLLLILFFVLLFGWLYGWYLLIHDIWRIRTRGAL